MWLAVALSAPLTACGSLPSVLQPLTQAVLAVSLAQAQETHSWLEISTGLSTCESAQLRNWQEKGWEEETQLVLPQGTFLYRQSLAFVWRNWIDLNAAHCVLDT